MYAGSTVAVNAAAKTFPGEVGVSKDPLKNDTQSPLIVRAFSCTVGWTIARASVATPLIFDVTVNTMRRGSYKIQQQSVQYAPHVNFVTGLYGSLNTAVRPYVWKFAVPALLQRGETILFEYGNVSSESVFVWSSSQAKASKYSIRCRGKVTGDLVLFGGGGTPTAGDRLVGVHQNLTDEDLEILSVTMVVGTATSDRPIFNMEIAGRRISRGERPFWLFAEPFTYGRFLFDRLPEGGLVLMPGDNFEVSVQNPQYTSLTVTLGLEAYQQVT
jgi:hypothetical protein